MAMKPCDPSTITFFYEPMHEVERLFDEAFSGSQESGSERKGYRRISWN